MTNEMHIVPLEGYPVQYPIAVVQHLNDVYNRRSTTNQKLINIGRTFSPAGSNTIMPETSDGYTWHGRLDFSTPEGNIAVLFPRTQLKNTSRAYVDTELDRSINVYSDKPIPKEKVQGLMERVGLQMALQSRPNEDAMGDLQMRLRFHPSQYIDLGF